MSLPNNKQSGFTITELTIVIVMIGIVSTILFTLTNTSINQYLMIQKDGMSFSELADQSQRVARVVRGLTDVVSANNDELTIYAYFSPNDNYVSLIRYYKNPGKTVLYADVTPMTANPPTGSLIESGKRTFTIISDFFQDPATSTFVYLDSVGSVLPLPISDLHTIKGVQINLATPSNAPSENANQAISVQVSLRNRKTNL